MTTWELLTIGLAIYSVCATFAAGCLYWERCYWEDRAKLTEEELHRVQADLGDAKEERDQWERRCARLPDERVA